MSARYCNNCGRIDPAVRHPLGGCTCPRPDFSVKQTAGEQIRSLEDQLATLRSDIAHVRGHLEGYADALLLLWPVPPDPHRLSQALREDAEKLLDQPSETAGAE
jgi:hypothetical protein